MHILHRFQILIRYTVVIKKKKKNAWANFRGLHASLCLKEKRRIHNQGITVTYLTIGLTYFIALSLTPSIYTYIHTYRLAWANVSMNAIWHLQVLYIFDDMWKAAFRIVVYVANATVCLNTSLRKLISIIHVSGCKALWFIWWTLLCLN